MTYFFYLLITLNGIMTAILGRRPITIDKTKHIQYRFLGAFEATIFPATLLGLFVAATVAGLSVGTEPEAAKKFLAGHTGTLNAVRLGTLGFYLLVMIFWERSIRARIAASCPA